MTSYIKHIYNPSLVRNVEGKIPNMQTLNRTYSMKKSEIKNGWFSIDGENLVVGRLAAEISKLLRGKHKPDYTPHMRCGDHVIVTNAHKVVFTGNKTDDKIYYRHTGYPGGIREATPKLVASRGFPERILRKAIERMLPKGPLGRDMIRMLYLYNTSEHPHAAQQPTVIDFGAQNRKNRR